MFIGIILIVALVIWVFLVRKGVNQSMELEENGGIETVYAELIQMIRNGDMNMRVKYKSNESIVLAGGGSTTNVVYQLYYVLGSGKLSITYSIDSLMTGKHSFQKRYDSTFTQQQIYNDLKIRINQLYQKMFR